MRVSERRAGQAADSASGDIPGHWPSPGVGCHALLSAAVTLDVWHAMISAGMGCQDRHERNHMPHVDLARRIRRRA